MRAKHNKREAYMQKLFAQEDEALLAIREAMREDGREAMSLSPTEGKVLHFLTKMVGAKKVLEIGTLFGYSALWIARALPADGKLICLEKDPICIENSNKLLGATEVADKVQVVPGRAMEILPAMEKEGPFDMLFIDADKGGYPQYLDWAEKNIRRGGLIVGDNTFLFDHVLGEGYLERIRVGQINAMNSFNKRLSDPTKFCSMMFPTAEGLTAGIKL